MFSPFKKSLLALLVFGILSAWTSASAQQANVLQPQLYLDRVRLADPTRALIVGDLNAMSQLQFGPSLDSPFKMVFGGSTAGDVTRYLLERVRYVGVYSSTNDQSALDPDTYAANFGPSFLSYYFHTAILKERRAHPDVMDFEHTQVVLNSPRVGFVGIGGAYVDPKTSQIDRLDTWVHEARHSDCARIPSAQDLALIDRDENGRVSLAGLACTHLHTPCQKGHPLEGQLACDSHPWGAYSVGYIFSKNVFRACSNCTEKQRQDALASATDDYSRLSPGLRQFYRNPNPPAPDLSSFDSRRFGGRR
jgi:hypothetical protein